MNISIKNIVMNETFNDVERKLHFEFFPIDMVKPGIKAEVHYHMFYQKEMGETIEKEDNDALFYFQKETSKGAIELVFTFQDIEGNNYKQINKFGNNEYQHGSVTLLKTGTKVISNPFCASKPGLFHSLWKTGLLNRTK